MLRLLPAPTELADRITCGTDWKAAQEHHDVRVHATLFALRRCSEILDDLGGAFPIQNGVFDTSAKIVLCNSMASTYWKAQHTGALT